MELKIFSPINTTFMYFDKPDFVADQIFINAKIKVNFAKDAAKDSEEYVICMVKVRKKNKDKFISCMGELRNKILLLDGVKYDEFCEKTMKMIWTEHSKK